LQARIVEQDGRIAVQDARIAELEAQVKASSRNSSRPPSSDGFSKPAADPKKRSLRRSFGRKQGGQEGHEGARLGLVAPDEQVEHPPERCEGCDADLADAERLEGGESRQVFDLPQGALLRVVEHVAERRRCGCGRVSSGEFPAGVRAPTQYGPGVRALGVYLCVFQHLPYDRAAQTLRDIAGAAVSTGTLTTWVTAAAAGLCDFDERLRGLLAAAPVAHFDETGARIAGRLGWVHSASTDKLTRYTAHARRGSEAIDAAGVLPGFEGVAVRDGWAPYRNYPGCDHGLCNIHHLRELQAAAEAGHTWPLAMSCLLLDTKDAVEQARGTGAERLGGGALADLAASYMTIIAIGHEEHPAAQGKRTKAHNLLLRLERYEPDVLRFAHDLRVPFGNNQAEQDIRMVKLQQKISGCWRTPEGAQRFLAVRSYISTARKNGLGARDALGRLAAGQPWLPAPGPT
jgi:transposase